MENLLSRKPEQLRPNDAYILEIKTETDSENLTFKISVLFWLHEVRIPPEDFAKPELLDGYAFFDVKNGVLDFRCFGAIEKTQYLKETENFDFLLVMLQNFEDYLIPPHITQFSYEKLFSLVQKFTGLPCDDIRDVPQKGDVFDQMLYITMLPFEYRLYPVMLSSSVEQALKGKQLTVSRSDPHAFEKFCAEMKIENAETILRSYENDPELFLKAVELALCGFRDIGIYKTALENPEYRRCFHGEIVAFFSRYSIQKRGERATLNMLKQLLEKSDKSEAAHIRIRVSLELFCNYFKYIPETLKEEILKDGFNGDNHDALAKISRQHTRRNVTFEYTGRQKELCGNVSGYEFALVKDSDQLREICAALHDSIVLCREDVLDDITVVYVQKDGEYKICMEIICWMEEVVRIRADCNRSLCEEEKNAIEQWMKQHALAYSKEC